MSENLIPTPPLTQITPNLDFVYMFLLTRRQGIQIQFQIVFLTLPLPPKPPRHLTPFSNCCFNIFKLLC